MPSPERLARSWCARGERASATTVAPFEYLSIVWGAAIDWVVWQVLPAGRIVAGAAIVAAAGLYLMHRARRAT